MSQTSRRFRECGFSEGACFAWRFTLLCERRRSPPAVGSRAVGSICRICQSIWKRFKAPRGDKFRSDVADRSAFQATLCVAIASVVKHDVKFWSHLWLSLSHSEIAFILFSARVQKPVGHRESLCMIAGVPRLKVEGGARSAVRRSSAQGRRRSRSAVLE